MAVRAQGKLRNLGERKIYSDKLEGIQIILTAVNTWGDDIRGKLTYANNEKLTL